MSAKLLIILCLALSASSSKSPLFMPTVPLPLAQTKEFLFGFGKGLHLFNYIDEPTLSKCFTVSIGMETNFSVLTTILANIQSVDDIYGRWSEISKYANFIYAEIKQQLEAKGHHFNSHSDTEVILHAYAEWGSVALQQFTGMFAFVIYDEAAKKIL